MKNLPIQTKPTRLWFTNQGCKQVPPEIFDGKILWAHPEGHFLNAAGQKRSTGFTPWKPSLNDRRSHSEYPKIGNNKLCHFLMAVAFFGARSTFTDKKGKPYVGICHHLIPNVLDFKPANLLCWLTREQHAIADSRQRVLKTIVPEGDLRGFDYDILREMQDPRTMTQDEFNRRMEYLRVMRQCEFDPRIFTANDLRKLFAMPFDEFKTMLEHHKNAE